LHLSSPLDFISEILPNERGFAKPLPRFARLFRATPMRREGGNFGAAEEKTRWFSNECKGAIANHLVNR
jgi:hypothetical protein